MNKRVINGLLIVLVIIIWGIIFYRLFNAFYSDTQEGEKPVSIKSLSSSLVENQKFVLNANYKDPFLGKANYYASINATTYPEVIKKSKPVVVVNSALQEEMLIDVKFMGIIKNKEVNKGIALINISGIELMMKEGEVKHEITLVKITKDSIQINSRKKLRWIRKN